MRSGQFLLLALALDCAAATPERRARADWPAGNDAAQQRTASVAAGGKWSAMVL